MRLPVGNQKSVHFVYTSVLIKTTEHSPRSQAATYFDHCNEQNSTDRGEKDGQNISGAGPARRVVVGAVIVGEMALSRSGCKGRPKLGPRDMPHEAASPAS